MINMKSKSTFLRTWHTIKKQKYCFSFYCGHRHAIKLSLLLICRVTALYRHQTRHLRSAPVWQRREQDIPHLPTGAQWHSMKAFLHPYFITSAQTSPSLVTKSCERAHLIGIVKSAQFPRECARTQTHSKEKHSSKSFCFRKLNFMSAGDTAGISHTHKRILRHLT